MRQVCERVLRSTLLFFLMADRQALFKSRDLHQSPGGCCIQLGLLKPLSKQEEFHVQVSASQL